MATNNSIKFDVGFNINQSDLNTLISSLRKVQTDMSRASSAGTLTAELKTAGEAAKQLETILNQAWNSKLNQLDLSRVNSSIQSTYGSVKQLKTAMEASGASGAAAYNQFASSVLNTNIQIKQSSQLLDKMAVTFKNTIRYGISSSIFNNLTSSLQQAFNYTRKLDSSLNDIRIVTDKSAESMERFAQQANRASKNLGASTLDYTNASLIYYQQGLSDEEVAARAETTIKAANVTGQTGEEVSEQLTAVWNGYKVTAEETEAYVDKLAAVAATTAADLEELSVGMSKVASAANAMGVDFDDLNAQIATIVSVTRQAPESVGTALKTIYARLGDLKVDGVDEFGTKLGEVSSQLQTMGIQILDQEGNLRDMSSVIAEVAEKWGTWTEAQRQAAAVAMAGKRQYNNLIALFDNWDMYSDALETSTEAIGTLQHQQDIYMESTAAHLQKLRTEAENTYDILFNQDTVNDMTDALTGLLSVFNNFLNGMGGGASALTALGTVATRVFSQQIGTGLGNVVLNAQKARENIEALNIKKEFIQQSMASGDTVSQAAAEKEAQLMEQTLLVSKGLTDEQYNQLMTLQKEVGQEELRIQTLSQYKTISQDILNLDDASLGTFQERLNIEQRSLQLAQSNLQFSERFAAMQRAIVLEEEDINILWDHLDNIMETSLLEASERVEIEKIEDSILEHNEVSQEEIQRIINLQNIALDRQKGLINQIEIGIEGKKAAEDGTLNQLKQEQIAREELIRQEQKQAAIRQDAQAYVQTLSSVVMLFTNLHGIIKTVNDDTLSWDEKVERIVTSLAFTLPMLITSIGAVKTSLSSLAIALDGTLAAEAAAAGGALTLGASLSALLPVALPIVAVLGALGLAAYGLYKAWNQENEAAEKAARQTKQISTAYDELKNKISSVKSELEQYQSARDALSELKTGTEEWNDAVSNLNDQVTELINKYPELAEGLEITNGVMTINEEIFKNFIKELQGKKAAAGIMQATANQTNVEAQREADRKYNKPKEYGQGLGINTSGAYDENGNYYYTSDFVTAEEYNKILTAVKDQGEEVLKNESYLVDTLGLSNDQAKAILENEELRTFITDDLNAELIEQKQLEAQRNAAIANYVQLTENQEYQALSASENIEDQNLANAINNVIIKKLSENSKRVSEALDSLEDKTKNEIESLWAEKLNLQKNEEGKYTNEAGEEVTFDLESAKQQLADVLATEKLVQQDMNKIIDGVKTGLQHTHAEYQEAISDFISGQGVDNLSQDQKAKLLNMQKMSGDDFIALLGLSQTDINAFGFKSGETFKQGLIKAILESDSQLDLFFENLSQKAKEAKNLLDSSAGGQFGSELSNQDQIQIGQDLENAADTSSLALAALTSAFSVGAEEALNLSNAIQDIDWSSFKNVDEAVRALERQGAVTEGNKEVIADYAHQMILASQAAQNLVTKLDEDVDEEEWTALANQFSELGSTIEGVSDDLEEHEEEAEEVAEDLLRYDSALEKIIDDYDNWEELLKSDNIQDNAKAASELRNIYADLLDLDPSDFSEGFLTSTENLKLLKEAANGSEEAYNALAEAAAKDILVKCGIDTSQFDEDKAYIESTIEALVGEDFGNIEVGTALNDEAFLAGLTDMVNAAGMTAQQATDYLSSMGVDAEVETVKDTSKDVHQYTGVKATVTTEEVEGIDPVSGNTIPYTFPSVSYETVPVQGEDIQEATSFALKVTSANKSSGGGFKFKNSSHGGGSAGRAARKSSGGKKGGGKGGGSKKTVKKYDDEFDRYWKINKAIDEVDRAIKKLDEDQEHLHGKQLINSLKQENKLLREQATNYKKLRAEQKKEAGELQGTLRKQGVKFDKEGNIKNYAAATKQAIKNYNSGKWSDEQYELFKKSLERYDTLFYEEMKDNEERLEENRRQRLENNLKKWETKIEVKLELKEAKRQWNDFIAEMSKDFRKVYPDTSIEINRISKNIDTYVGKGGTLETDRKVISDIEKEIDKLATIGKSSKYNSISEAQEALKEARTTWQEDVEALNELYQDAWNTLLDGIDQFADKFDTIQDRFEKINDELSYQRELIELIYGDEAYDLMNTFYKAQETANLSRISSLRIEADAWKKQLDDSFAETGHTLDNFFEWNEDEQKYYEQWQEAQSKLKDEVVNDIKTIQEQYSNSINAIMLQLEKGLTGGSRLDDVELQWERISANADKYYDSTEKAYQIQTLSNKINKDIAATNNLKIQQRLEEFREKELAELQAKDKLTEYDIKRAEARYELMQKQIALENSQNNKTSMKLTRNEQGNWSYQYVADDSDIASKRQDLLDSWNALYQLASDAYEGNLKSLQDLQKTYLEQSKANAELALTNKDLANQRQLELDQWYYEQYQLLANENSEYRTDLQIATVGVLKTIYEQDYQNYETFTDDQKKLIDSVKDTSIQDYLDIETAVKKNINNIGEKSETVLSTIRSDWNSLAQQIANQWNKDNGKSVTAIVKNAYSEIQSANSTYISELQNLQTVSGETFGENGIKGNIDAATSSLDSLSENTKTLAETDLPEWVKKMNTQIKKIEKAWKKVYNQLSDVNDEIETYLKKVQAASKVQPSTIKSGVGTTASGSTSNGGSAGGTGSGGSKSGSSEGNKGVTYWDAYSAVGVNYNTKGTKVGSKIATSEKGAKEWANKNNYNVVSTNSSAHYIIVTKKRISVTKPSSGGGGGGITQYQKTYATGGYTGTWNNGSDEDNGRWALLHQKELVLNADDTSNFLSGINMIRDMSSLNGSINKSIVKAIANMMVSVSGMKPGIVSGGTETENTSNVFNITADFPNAENVNEIREAILSLPNIAAQYANQHKL